MSANNYMMVLERKKHKKPYKVFMVDADTGVMLGKKKEYKNLREALADAQITADLECEYGLRVELL